MDNQVLLNDKNIAKVLIWREGDTFRWSTVTVLNGPNIHGQYHVMALRDGWYATTNRIRNLNNEERNRIFNLQL